MRKEHMPAEKARKIAKNYIESDFPGLDVEYPVLVERFGVWRSTLKHKGQPVGEVVLDSASGNIDEKRTTDFALMTRRVENADKCEEKRENARKKRKPTLSSLKNTIGCGDSEEMLSMFPDESVDLVFTSPPYYNVRPEYQEYIDYEDYLEKMRMIFSECFRVLHEGRFFVLNVSMALLRRPTSKESSKRLAIPFDLHNVLVQEGFEFIDDIIWEKPEGAGWVSGRGRNFAMNRKPLAYKPVPVTEYVLVYRKKSENLLGWNISGHPDQEAVERSKINDDYEKTNVWKLSPSHSREHPATFPKALAERVIRYYSFEGDVVLDPFAGIGTTAQTAIELKRRFVMLEQDIEYIKIFRNQLNNSALDLNGIDLINIS